MGYDIHEAVCTDTQVNEESVRANPNRPSVPSLLLAYVHSLENEDGLSVAASTHTAGCETVYCFCFDQNLTP